MRAQEQTDGEVPILRNCTCWSMELLHMMTGKHKSLMVFGCGYLAVAFGQFTAPISQWQS